MNNLAFIKFFTSIYTVAASFCIAGFYFFSSRIHETTISYNKTVAIEKEKIAGFEDRINDLKKHVYV